MIPAVRFFSRGFSFGEPGTTLLLRLGQAKKHSLWLVGVVALALWLRHYCALDAVRCVSGFLRGTGGGCLLMSGHGVTVHTVVRTQP